MNPKNKKGTTLLLLAILLLLFIVGVFLVIKNLPQKSTNEGSSVKQHINWKTYNNEKFGFSLEYPQNAALEDFSHADEMRTSVHILPQSRNGDAFYYSVVADISDVDFSIDTVKNGTETLPFSFFVHRKPKQININGFEAIYVEYGDRTMKDKKQLVTFIPIDGKRYIEFSYWTSEEKRKANFVLANEILETLKLTR